MSAKRRKNEKQHKKNGSKEDEKVEKGGKKNVLEREKQNKQRNGET